jgi:hypothetical protein
MNVYEYLGIEKGTQIPSSIIDAIVRTEIPKGEKAVAIKNPSRIGDKEIIVTKELKSQIPCKRKSGKHHSGKPKTLMQRLGL